MKDLTEELELTKQNLMFERQKIQNNITEEPEQDFHEQLRSQKLHYEDLLKEKDIEIDHLDQRLRERSEKLNDQMSKVNIGTGIYGPLRILKYWSWSDLVRGLSKILVRSGPKSSILSWS